MSRENRRRAARRPDGATAVQERPTPAPIAGAPGASDGERHISWRHVLVGVVAGEAVLLLLSNGGLAVANALFGSTGQARADGGIVGVSSFLAVLAGGFLAARLAGRWGVYQGTVVGIGFIVVAALYEFAKEASIVHASLSGGSHTLIDLGPMNMGNLITGDLLALFGGGVGGWLARRR